MIAVLSNIDTPRLRYALGFLLEGFSFEIFAEDASIPQGAKVLSYGVQSKVALLHVPNLDFPWWLETSREVADYRAALTDLPSFGKFDLFGYAFYLLARCDEYLPNAHDELGRFLSIGCIQNQWNGIHVAYLEEWRLQLLTALGLSELRRTQQQLTVDIDSPFAFRYKSWMKQMLGLMRDMVQCKWDWVSRRLQVALGGDDPYDTYSVIQDRCTKVQFDLIFFVLCAKRGKWDRGMEWRQSSGWQALFSLLGSVQWAWHPSVQGHHEEALFEEELKRLEEAKGEKIRAARFHYLKQAMPGSPSLLLTLGVEEDYTMGFVDVVGYRAGTSRPFYWFDWEKGSVTTLKVVPFWGMDVALKNYMKCTPDQAALKVEQARAYIEGCNGDWRMIWHNESVNDWSEWKGWEKVLEQFLKR